jgi:hypothetical protein
MMVYKSMRASGGKGANEVGRRITMRTVLVVKIMI